MAPRAWYREYFTDHPHYRPGQRQGERNDYVWANARKDKPKVICTPCLDRRASAIQVEEEQRVLQDPSFLARSREDIILSRQSLSMLFFL